MQVNERERLHDKIALNPETFLQRDVQQVLSTLAPLLQVSFHGLVLRTMPFCQELIYVD